MRFRDPVIVGRALLVFERPEPVVLHGHILVTAPRTVREVTDEEARTDGFTGRERVLPALREDYPGLRADDDIVLVHFAVDTECVVVTQHRAE